MITTYMNFAKQFLKLKMSRKENPIVESKSEHAKFTVADTPHEFSTGITLSPKQLKLVNDTPGGHHFKLSDLIDNYPAFEDRLKLLYANQYSLDDPDKFLLNFLLISAGISGIRTPDPYNGLTFGGSLTQRAHHAGTMPTDVLTPDKEHKKLLARNVAPSFIDGHDHTFSHTLTPEMAKKNYTLLNEGFVLNDRLICPQTKAREGTGGVLPDDNRALVEYVKNRANGVFLPGHSVNNESMYPTKSHLPTRTEMLTADSKKGGVVESQHSVALRNGGFPSTWYETKADDQRHIRDEGVQAPLDDFAYKNFHFIDSLNEARSTNFHNTGLWLDMDHFKLDNVPKVTAKLSFKILPIVPYHAEGKEFIPYHNFVKHLKSEITEVDKPFSESKN